MKALALKLVLIVFIAVGLSAGDQATATPIDPGYAVNNWNAGRDPVSLGSMVYAIWGVESHSTEPLAGIVNDENNVSLPTGALTSDFITTGDFEFSGLMRATGPCAGGGAFGIVFGWQDPSNTYYLKWRGSSTNGSGITSPGFSLATKIGSDTTILESDYDFDDYTWVENGWYLFDLVRSGDELSIFVTRYGIGMLPTFSATVLDATFMSGRVGLWGSAQTAEWANLVIEPSPVPEPATMLLLGSGLLGLAGLRRKFKRK